MIERDRARCDLCKLPQLRWSVVFADTVDEGVAVGDVGDEIGAGKGGVAALETEVKHGQLMSNSPDTIVMVAPSGKAFPHPSS